MTLDAFLALPWWAIIPTVSGCVAAIVTALDRADERRRSR